MEKEIGIAVVDVETTGFRDSDRIVEIAIIRIDRQFRRVREYQTLINPRRDVGPTHIHRISASMVHDAPVFDEVAEEILSYIPENTLIVGHNVSFDLKFIERELSRALGRVISYPRFCTLKEGRKLLSSSSYSLGNLCRLLNISNELEHSAMGDARATLLLFKHLTGLLERESSVNILATYREQPVPPAVPSRTKLRGTDPAAPTSPFRIRRPGGPVPAYKGKTVCFTGTSLARSEEGERLSRRELENIAAEGGMMIRSYVTKKLDCLVAADPHSQSGKARKAGAYGVRILSEREFWEGMGVLVPSKDPRQDSRRL